SATATGSPSGPASASTVPKLVSAITRCRAVSSRPDSGRPSRSDMKASTARTGPARRSSRLDSADSKSASHAARPTTRRPTTRVDAGEPDEAPVDVPVRRPEGPARANEQGKPLLGVGVARRIANPLHVAPLCNPVEDRLQQPCFGPELVVDGHPGDVGGAGDGVDREGAEAT